MAIKHKYNLRLIALIASAVLALPFLVIASQNRTHIIPKAAYLRPNIAKLPIPSPTSYICNPGAKSPCPTGFTCMSGICRKISTPTPLPTLPPTATQPAALSLTINTEYLPSPWEKTKYSYPIQASINRNTPITMKISGLPSGLTTGTCTNSRILPSSISGNKLTASYVTCQITGTPLVSGTFPFTVTVSDENNHTTTKKISITIRKKSVLTNFLSLFRPN